NFTYSPGSKSFTTLAGNVASFTESVTAPKNNGTFDAQLVMTGTGGTPINPAWMTTVPVGDKPFATGGSGGSDVTNSWPVNINMAGQPDGVYTGHITASRTSGTAGPSTGQGTDVTITIDHTPPGPPSTPDLSPGDDTGVSNTDNITNKTANL